VVLPYLAGNVVGYGAIAPISSAVKSGYATVSIAKVGRQGLVVAMLGFVGTVAVWFLRAPARSIVAALALGTAAHFIYVVVRMDAVWTWYFGGELLSACVFVAVAVVADAGQASYYAARSGNSTSSEPDL
jgi:hypothetical protein